MLYSMFGVPICAIYCNTILATLNTRRYLGNKSGLQYITLDFLANAIPDAPVSTPPEVSVHSNRRERLTGWHG